MKKFLIFTVISFAIIIGTQVYAANEPTIYSEPSIPIAVQMDEKAAALTDLDLVDLAAKYQAISDRNANFSPTQINRLHELNPNILITKYINFSARFGEQQQWLLEYHPDWVLRNKEGKPEPAIWGAGNGISLDPANEGWRSYLVEQVSKTITEGGYDGVMADVVLMANKLPPKFTGINPKTRLVYTTEEWRNAQYETLRAVKERIGKDKKLIANSVRFGKAYFEEGSSRFLEVVDGVVAEEFRGLTNWPLDKFVPEDIWKMNIDMLTDVQSKGKIIVANAKYSEEVLTDEIQKTQFDNYILATFLLGKGGLSYFSSAILDYQNFSVKSDYKTVWKAKIGTPTNFYYKKDGVYQRDFEFGKVLVNPTYNTLTINLGGSYKTLEGNTVVSLTLNHHQGIILTK